VTQRAAATLPRRALAGGAAGKTLEALTLAGLVALVPRALGPADYGAFAVALAVATGIATATGVGGPALFARALAPLAAAARRDVARALVTRVAVARAALLALVATAAAAGALLAPGSVSALQLGIVGAAAVLGAGATLVSQLALGLGRTVAWSLRYPLENGIVVAGALVLYPLAGLDGALAAIALGAAAALALGLATAWPALRGARAGRALPAGTLRVARLQAAGGALTQAVHRGAAPASALLGLTSAATGHAAIAAGAALAITYAVAQTMLVALPAATRAFSRDRAGAEAALRRVALACGTVVVPACALLALAEPVLATALGEEFRDAAPPLRVALGAAALAPPWALATQLAALRNRPEAALAGAVGGVVAFAAVAVVAIPAAGASGAAAAMLAGVGTTIAGTVAALRARGARS
jgi:O-antigen/teichoic acid export membrane protein